MAIKYFKTVTDDNGFVHSIDNVKCFYYTGNIENILPRFQALSGKCKNYYDKLNCAPSVKGQFWKHHLHIDDVYVRLGRFVAKPLEKKDGYVEYDALSLEVNPNKHWDSTLLSDVLAIVNDVSNGGYLDQIDYTIDIACGLDDVVVLGTRKIPGLYKGTKYYGCRGQHGFVRIYDKAAEAELDYPLTRVETQLKVGKKFSSVDFGIINHIQESGEKLSNSTGLIVDLLKELQLLGSNNIDAYLERMNYRTRVQVLNNLSGKTVKHVHNPVILDELIAQVKEFFGLSDNPDEKHNMFEVDSDGFLIDNGDTDDMLPLPDGFLK